MSTDQEQPPKPPTYTPDLHEVPLGDFKKLLPLEHGDRALVIKVYDGDTLTVGFRHRSKTVKESVRIRGIDTPEMRSKSEHEKELAMLAKTRLSEATLGEVVTVVSPETDKYGRLLCDLSTEKIHEKYISEYMLEAPDICRKYDGGTRQPW